MPTRHPSPITPRPHRSLEGEGEDISHSAPIHKLLELLSIIRGDVVTGLRPPHPTLIKAPIFRHPPFRFAEFVSLFVNFNLSLTVVLMAIYDPNLGKTLLFVS